MSITLSPQQDVAVGAFSDWIKPILSRQKQYVHQMGDGTQMECWGNADDDSPFYLQEGYAGTGKSTILPFIIAASGLSPTDVAFIAPTGKAAKVMTTKLKAQSILKPATTIHRAIYRPKAMRADTLEREIEILHARARSAQGQEAHEIQNQLRQLTRDLERAYLQNSPAFQLNVDAPSVRGARLVVVDECSMVGENIADDLRSFGVPILAIGDSAQLQPVQDRPGFCFKQPNNQLTEIHRQALDNPIIWASKIIREGGHLDYGVHDGGKLRVIEPKDDDVTYDQTRDVQILVGTNARRWQITRRLRKEAGLHVAGPTEGEMMIVIKNSRVHGDLVNGTQVIITEDTGDLKAGDSTCWMKCQDEDGTKYRLECVQAVLEENYLGLGGASVPDKMVFHVKKAEKVHQIDWAYAITVHKAQGSQWNDVCVHDESNSFRDKAKSWLYTAVTRAAETLTLII